MSQVEHNAHGKSPPGVANAAVRDQSDVSARPLHLSRECFARNDATAVRVIFCRGTSVEGHEGRLGDR
jgi:hypothetical protein